MYIYEIIAMILMGINHVLFYLQLIRYHRLSYTMVIILSILFTILLGIIITVTGYPEFNIIMFLLFLLSLGLMKDDLTILKNLYFTLASIVSVTLVKIVLVEFGIAIFMWSSLNFYVWTSGVIEFIVSLIIFLGIVFLRKQIQAFAQYIVQSRLYYISFGILILGTIVVLILTIPSTNFLATLYHRYEQIGYMMAFILFFVLLLMVLIGSHLTKEKLIVEQQDRLDQELLDYVEKLEVMHDELASFRHDYINVLLTLDEGIRTKNMIQIEQIYHEVIAPTFKLINHRELDIVKLSRISIPEVKSLLSVKLIDAQRENIHVMIDIPESIEETTLPRVDFIRMISILVDNGIEEASNSKDKVLQIAFFENKENQYFIVRNSSEKQNMNLEQIYEKQYSSKKDHRGYGLYSLKRMIDDTAKATLETSFKDSIFTQTIRIKKQ